MKSKLERRIKIAIVGCVRALAADQLPSDADFSLALHAGETAETLHAKAQAWKDSHPLAPPEPIIGRDFDPHSLTAEQILALDESQLATGSNPNLKGCNGESFTYPANACSVRFHPEFCAFVRGGGVYIPVRHC